MIFMPPTIGGGGGHIVFSADPVGIGVLVGVASCLRSISLMIEWILAKRA